MRISWPIPTRFPTLSSGDVHLWRISRESTAEQTAALQRFLSADEQVRAARYRAARDRRRYVVTRGVLRALLGRYLGVEPAAVHLQYQRYGKPVLAGPSATLRFNLSHSGELALFAVTQRRELGVDVERVRPDFGGMAVARRFFAPREVATLQALAPDEQSRAFFRCWTRKEAYIKARGEGLAVRLDSFDVTLTPAEPAALLEVRDAPAEVARWRLQDVSPSEEYIAALAVEGHDWHLRCWQWE